jgi:polyhydroxyalkanoate synthesis repressor PhaR
VSETTSPESTPAETSAKVIKRYANRKLYDTVESRYVTLEEIAEMVKVGVEVRIVDNKTKEDLTSITLAQIIFEEEKRESQMPLGVLRRIIQGGGTAVQGFIAERVSPQVDRLREEAGSRVGRIFKREEARVAHARELFSQSQRTLEDWQRRVDEHVRGAVEAVTGLTQLQRELQRLHDRLDSLEKKVSSLDE